MADVTAYGYTSPTGGDLVAGYKNGYLDYVGQPDGFSPMFLVGAIIPSILSVSAITHRVDVVFTNPITLTACGLLTGAWTFSNGVGSVPLSCSAVVADVDGVTVHLTVNTMTIGVNNYTVHVAAGSVVTVSGGVNIVDTLAFSGINAPFTILGVTVDDTDTIEVQFSAPPDYGSALLLGNYTFDHGLVATAITAEATINSVRVDTSRMTPGIIYLLTISGVTDVANNPLT